MLSIEFTSTAELLHRVKSLPKGPARDAVISELESRDDERPRWSVSYYKDAEGVQCRDEIRIPRFNYAIL
jgi:hypothetical protein